MTKDYYKILGVNKNSSADEIKSAYRKLAKQYHPDKTKGDKAAETKFKEASEAYNTLGDKEKRQQYDNPNQGFAFNNFDFNDFGFSFNPFAQQKPKKGKDIYVETVVTLKEVALGVSKEINFNQVDTCKRCRGFGGTGENCAACNGAGRRQFRRGMQTVITHCETCNGSGFKVTNECSTCSGSGNITVNKTLSIKIPPGINHGEILVIRNQGCLTNASLPRGDLKCFIKVLHSKDFVRDHNNLICKIAIGIPDACLGKTISVDTIYDESIELKIPAGIQHNQILKVSGKGLPGQSSGKGDMLVVVEINIPKKITDKGKKLLKQLQKELL